MLIRFRVQNHRSIRDEQTLSMVASDQLDDPRLLSSPAIAEKLVPVAAIYGANASGKSNLLDAMAFARNVVDESHRAWKPMGGVPHHPFALSSRADEPSTYEFDFILGATRYTYGFELTAERVEGEWLYELHRAGKTLLFERARDAFDFGADLGPGGDIVRGLTRPNSLFLSAAAQNNHGRLAPIADWVVRRLNVRIGVRDQLAVAAQIGLSFLETGPPGGVIQLVLSFLRDADIGIDDLRLGGPDLVPEARIQFHHQGGEDARGWLRLAEESAGTQVMFELAWPLLIAIANGFCFCIDELEGSLHPVLASRLVGWVQTHAHDRGGQVIFSTHDANLIGRATGLSLRRDQIWFTEKTEEGATELYPLSDFESRGDENFETGYLQGRYGAIPVLGDFAALLDKKAV